MRDEGDKITLALKMIKGETISDQKEIEIKVNDFGSAVSILDIIGCEKKELQISKRELWSIKGVNITIDTWPTLETFIEIEGSSEQAVKTVSELLGFKFETALFCSVGRLYKMKYGISLDEIEKKYGEITFDNKKLETLTAL